MFTCLSICLSLHECHIVLTFCNCDVCSTDSPVLWVRFDPDLHWLREFHIQQPDYMWQLQLKYERDINAQLDVMQ